MNESQWDKLLRIKTSGRDDSKADQYYYPYEPTPYSVLERLANEEYIGKKNLLIDYGCGKGRVDFFLSYHGGEQKTSARGSGRSNQVHVSQISGW